MTQFKSIQNIALSFEESMEQPHFHKTSFRVRKKIFATYDESTQELMVKLSLVDQSAFCSWNPKAVYPVPGAWGKQGCTYFNIRLVPVNMLRDALTIAYCSTAPIKLADKYRNTK